MTGKHNTTEQKHKDGQCREPVRNRVGRVKTDAFPEFQEGLWVELGKLETTGQNL